MLRLCLFAYASNGIGGTARACLRKFLKHLAANKPSEEILNKQSVGAAAGISAPILAFICILTAIASYPKFSWVHNALSDLGVVKGLTGPLFNFGLYTGGFLGLVFAVLGLYSYGKNTVGKVGGLTFAAASAALIAIGVFNESFHGVHFAVSAAFFVLAPIALFILTCSFMLARQKRLAVLTVAVGVAAALPWVVQFTVHYVPAVAIPETISAVAISAWTITLSVEMLKEAQS